MDSPRPEQREEEKNQEVAFYEFELWNDCFLQKKQTSETIHPKKRVFLQKKTTIPPPLLEASHTLVSLATSS